MDITKVIAQGRSYFLSLMVALIVLSLIVVIYELSNWQSSTLLIVQIVVSLQVMSLALLTYYGYKTRWTFFIVLLLAGFLAFYMGGSRMGNFEQGEVSLASYLSVCAGLAYIGSAIFLAFSVEIGLFLRTKMEKDTSATPPANNNGI